MTQVEWLPDVATAILELDTQLARVVPAAMAAGYTVMITGDHGNAEEMLKNGKARPSHTNNKVPFIVLGLDAEELKGGVRLNADFTIGAMGSTALALRGMPAPSTWNQPNVLEGPINARADRKIMRLVLDG